MDKALVFPSIVRALGSKASEQFSRPAWSVKRSSGGLCRGSERPPAGGRGGIERRRGRQRRRQKTDRLRDAGPGWLAQSLDQRRRQKRIVDRDRAPVAFRQIGQTHAPDAQEFVFRIAKHAVAFRLALVSRDYVLEGGV